MMLLEKLKGQSAIEYLLTYGWMVIALVAIIAALFYLGILNPGTWFATSNEVLGMSTYTVTDFTITPSGYLTLYVKSSVGTKTRITGVKVKGISLTSISPTTPIDMNPGQNRTISGYANLTGESGTSFYNSNLEIIYDVVGGGTNHTDSGVMRGRFS